MKLTNAQAETIRILWNSGFQNGEFLPLDAFPGRDNEDNGHRRTLKTLRIKGLLMDGVSLGAYIMKKNECYAAYQEWQKKVSA